MNHLTSALCWLGLLAAVFCLPVQAGETPVPQKAKTSPAPFWIPEGENPNPTPPTQANIPYGKHPKQVMDFWNATCCIPVPRACRGPTLSSF